MPSQVQLRRRMAGLGAGVGVGVLAIAVPLTVAERERPSPVPAAPVPAMAGELTPPALTPREQQALPVTTGRPVPGVVKGNPGWNGCAADLLTVLQKSDPARHLGGAQVDCYEGYAVARTAEATVLFRYAETTGAWRAISEETSSGCAEAPEAVRKHLQGCG